MAIDIIGSYRKWSLLTAPPIILGGIVGTVIVCDFLFRKIMILESNLVPSASTSESKVFYLKMKGIIIGQRSSQCTMCWQPISLKDPNSQELLDAIERERSIRTNPSRNTAIFHHPTLGDFELKHLPISATDTELEELIIQHLPAAAAMGSDAMQNFFKKHGIAVMTIRELFDFIVDPSINDDSLDSYLEKAQQKFLARGDVIFVEDEITDSVFVQSYIPKTLDDVKHAEEDVQRIISGKDTGDMYYQTITGLKHLAKTQPSPAKEQLQQEGDLIPVPPTAPSEHSSSHEIESEDETDEGEDSLTDLEGYVSNVSCHGPILVQLEL